MPIIKFVCPTFSEDIEAEAPLSKILSLTSFPDLCTEQRMPFQERLNSIVTKAHELDIPLALVDGILDNTPALSYSTWESGRDIFELQEHRALSLLPIDTDPKPATLLAQIIYHRRKYIGEGHKDCPTGTEQRYLEVRYSESFGIFSLSESKSGEISVDRELGTVAGELPLTPANIPLNKFISAVEKFSSFIAFQPAIKTTDSTIHLNRYGFVCVEKSPPDTDELHNFVRMKELRFMQVDINGPKPWPRPPLT